MAQAVCIADSPEDDSRYAPRRDEEEQHHETFLYETAKSAYPREHYKDRASCTPHHDQIGTAEEVADRAGIIQQPLVGAVDGLGRREHRYPKGEFRQEKRRDNHGGGHDQREGSGPEINARSKEEQGGENAAEQ